MAEQNINEERPNDSFLEWLKSVNLIFPILSLILGAFLGIFAPEKIIPEPLSVIKIMGTVIIVVAFIFTYVWRDFIKSKLKLISLSMLALLIVIIILNLFFVKMVTYHNPHENVYYLVGNSTTDEKFDNIPNDELIRQTGGEWETLNEIYKNYTLISLIFSFSYLLLMIAIVFSIGGASMKNRLNSNPNLKN
tara:strand:- start:421734 stop:422309 length:576 start_codon:yes stop_codon:yes gene_type:complete